LQSGASTSFKPLEQVPLARRSTLGVGGSAQFYADIAGDAALAEALGWARERGLPVTVLGGGSNVVIADAGIAGLVIRLSGDTEHVTRLGSDVEVRVSAGADWDGFVARAVARGWAGLECLSGIPGSVGATPIQNVGAYGQEVSETIARVHVYDRQLDAGVELGNAECGFAYRSSRFKADDDGRFVVLAVTFRLRVGGTPCLRYPDVAAALGAAAPTLAAVRDAVLGVRASKSMVLAPADPNRRSCGSFFLNPIVLRSVFERVLAASSEPVPHFDQPSGDVKVPAAWLIERAGFQRGQRFGAVGISSRHSLALVCHDGARASDVVALAQRVRDAVEQKFGIRLVPEPRFLGFGTPPGELPSS
jgi:UDP-N-acetylmuramate dehydrogenase